MNKTELVNQVAARASVTKAKAAEVVDAIFHPETGVIAQLLAEGDEIGFQGFGTFKSKVRPARKGVNPKTGQPLEIKAKRGVKFTAGKTLAERVAENPGVSG